MTSPLFPTERHLSDAVADAYEYSALAKNILHKVLMEMELPNVFGLYGDWGSGKTTLLHLIQEQIKEDPALKEEVVVVYFEAWKYEYAKEGDLVFALLRKIGAALKADATTKEALKRVMVLLSCLGCGIVNLFPKILAEGLKPDAAKIGKAITEIEEAILEKHQTWVDETADLHKTFAELIKNGLGDKKKLFIIVDDLDRCLPENAIRLLEAMKNYLMVPETLFLFAVDQRVIVQMVEQKYGLHKGFGEEYLMKIIQYHWELPRQNLEVLVQTIFEAHAIPFDSFVPPYIAKLLLAGDSGEIRKAKHFLQHFAMKLHLKEALFQYVRSVPEGAEKPDSDNLLYLFLADFLLLKYRRIFSQNPPAKLIQNIAEGISSKADLTKINAQVELSTSDREALEMIFVQPIEAAKVREQMERSPERPEVLDIRRLQKAMELLRRV